ncbi:serine/threonine-protein phosphatase 7 long form homolog [Helianthus annuus]|uniref:serine/threonine-protein phosphatase 7 long form homolog n=1 Tax=Helianthus annuus TaxID=4232 RepID=UPI000B906C64|nr:serine/threonine-protein phosphatase 7 long form homolog [Helianthus annuus]
MSIKRADRQFWSLIKDNPIGPRVQSIIRQAGFGGILDSGYRYIDHALITALVERWRPETHTFHLPFGETTVTLQDINVLWGLPINGEVFSGMETPITFTNGVIMCQNLLGFTPEKNHFWGKRINSVRCTLFPVNSNNWIALHYLPFLEDLGQCSQISWGSAVLGCLYRNLCNATAPNAVGLTGPVSILQVWAWERIRCLPPEPNAIFNYRAPIAARWKGSLNAVDVPTHCLRTYRSQLQSLKEAMFIWRPYDAMVDSLPEICTSGRNSWRCVCPLICWDVVEHHYPQRVMRQFGMVQCIPPPINIEVGEHERLHSLVRNGKTGWDWKSRHEPYVNAWNHREHNVVNGQQIETYSVANDYMTWYLEHTVVYLTNPRQPLEPMAGFQDDGATVRMMADSLGVIHQSQDMEMMQQTAYRALNMSNLAEYTQYPTNLTNDPVDLSSYPSSQRIRRRRRRGRGAANVQDTSAGQWGRNYEEGGASGVNHEQNNEPNFNGLNGADIGNVTNTFVDQNTVATHAIQSWQRLLASAVNEDPRYDISELLEST